MEAGQGLGVTVGLQTYGTLDLLFQQLQGLCESPALGERATQNSQLTELSKSRLYVKQTSCVHSGSQLILQRSGRAQTYFSFEAGASAILRYKTVSTITKKDEEPSLVPRPSALRPFGKLEWEKWNLLPFFPLQFSEGAWCGGSGDETTKSLGLGGRIFFLDALST